MDDTAAGEVQTDLLLEAENLYRDAATELFAAIRRVRQGDAEDAKATALAMRDLKSALQMSMDERTRIEKLRKQVAGIVHDHALDFDAARDEIGRRLARLRDAGAGG
jgi:ABC-type phosphate transport system auxiliary subunit